MPAEPIEMRGLENLTRRWETASRQLASELRTTTQQAVLYVLGQVPRYPQPPPTSRYRRTGTLGRSLTTMQGMGGAVGSLSRVESLGGEVVGVIGTSIRYGPYVIDERRQAWMHRGRWWTLQGVVQQSRQGIVAIYRRMVQRLAGG